MRYEWDERKRQANIIKHGFDFADVKNFDWQKSAIVEDSRKDEPRLVAFGHIFGRMVAVVFTIRGERTRIISMRRANRREEKRYG